MNMLKTANAVALHGHSAVRPPETYRCKEPGSEIKEHDQGESNARRTKRDGGKAVAGPAVTAYNPSRGATVTRRATASLTKKKQKTG